MTRPRPYRLRSPNAQSSRICSCFLNCVLIFLFCSIAMCMEFSLSDTSSTSYDQVPCSVFCDCLGPEFAVQADCSNRTLTTVPADLSHGTVKL
ncbi:uncharacterized protein TNCT_70281 [Trichonephila clavata]|uniref:Uncharacterized protein n=1 Tax=Trichonephila clavata TaxID=2740835 RepID=A0A8X6GUW4_TRICU|nr:uncharacterized protein TNCT_70281 [Trichonephila clavata]